MTQLSYKDQAKMLAGPIALLKLRATRAAYKFSLLNSSTLHHVLAAPILACVAAYQTMRIKYWEDAP